MEPSTSDSPITYITTTLPYVNSDPHIGFAMEIIRADVITRYKRLQGVDVFFTTGTDEHGAKIYENAVKEGRDVQEYVDAYSAAFKKLIQEARISGVFFIRTTDEKHIRAAREMWKRCYDNGYIYKKIYRAKYCVGCELNKTDSELVDGKCLLHPTRDIELIDEENYFFKWSQFSGRGHKDSLLDFYDRNPNFVVPDFRYNEIKAFVERGLEDFSISRLKEKMPWGIAVPKGGCDEGDEDRHVMYVWFDALTSYISTLNWPDDISETNHFETYWIQEGNEKREVIQYCGKDNLRQQSAMWQAMLMASGIPNSTQIIIDGFITSGGQKMSKSTGNVISPFDVMDMFKEVTECPEDVLRFVLLHDISSFEDGDITFEGIKQSYQAHLANGIGNLTSRIMKMVVMNEVNIGVVHANLTDIMAGVRKAQADVLATYDIRKAIADTMQLVSQIDKYIQDNEPFKVIKIDREKGEEMVVHLVRSLLEVSTSLQPFLPRTASKIRECISESKVPEKPLFNRLP